MGDLVAGHEFKNGPNGERCVRSKGAAYTSQEPCNVAWVDISGTTRDQIDQTGIAHLGPLTETEYEQIERKREARYALGFGG